jgi:hypothetical protein
MVLNIDIMIMIAFRLMPMEVVVVMMMMMHTVNRDNIFYILVLFRVKFRSYDYCH